MMSSMDPPDRIAPHNFDGRQAENGRREDATLSGRNKVKKRTESCPVY